MANMIYQDILYGSQVSDKFVFQMIHSGHIKIYFTSVERTYTTNLQTQFGNARTAVHNEAMSYPPKKPESEVKPSLLLC